jgi:hypothetical protein
MEPHLAPSPLYRLADTLIEGGAAAFISDRRREGVSWRRIARDLRDATDGSVDVTEQTLRSWHPELMTTAAVSNAT